MLSGNEGEELAAELAEVSDFPNEIPGDHAP
jgi:hypothetical protein